MTKEEIEKYIDGFIDREDVVDWLKKESLKLAISGGIEMENANYDYSAAKIILHVALQNLALQYTPLQRAGKNIAENLTHF